MKIFSSVARATILLKEIIKMMSFMAETVTIVSSVALVKTALFLAILIKV